MDVRSRIPLIVAVSYASIALCLFVFAMVVHDEFGFSGIPVLYVTYPLSFFLYKHFDFLPSIVAGGAVNTLVLFALLKGVAYFMEPSRRK
jgi:hypothetical protein